MMRSASDVVRSPAELSPSGPARAYVAVESAAIRLDSGYERSVAKGTRFAESSSTQRIVGFYLPVERAFSPLSYPANLMLEERKP